MRNTPRSDAAGIGLCLLLVTLSSAGDAWSAASSQDWRPVTAAVHVHSSISTGDDSLDTLVVKAQASGIEAIFLTDNYLLRYEYGLFPLRGLLRRIVELPSVMRTGVGRFLSDVREANRRHPDVLLIPGVEVVPLYYWTGSVFSRNLTMHDAQKNLLVLGLTAEDEYLRLPGAGNRAAYEYGWNTVVLLWPVLLVPPAIWLINRRVDRRMGAGWTFMVVCERRPAPGVALLTLAVLLLVNNYPFGTSPYDTYSDENGLRPHQGLIDYVRQRGGISIWSLPEARDFNKYDYGRLGVVTVKTDPYPEALLQTSGFTGFGAVYQDQSTITEPGGIGDALLLDYARGRRAQPPWGVGEIAYHVTGEAGIELYQVETVLWVKEKTPAALLDALAKGRMYALERRKDYGLVLNEFSVTSEETGQSVISGETLEAPANAPFRVRVEVSSTDGQRRPVLAQVIRSGLVLSSTTETTPFSVQLRDVVPQGTGGYFRLLIGSADHRIVSNPIFVRSRASLTGALP
jgi:hypothetical protein